jgi:hypothetical protein
VVALECKFSDRGIVKSHGAQWNAVAKRWYFTQTAWTAIDENAKNEVADTGRVMWAEVSTDGMFTYGPAVAIPARVAF